MNETFSIENYPIYYFFFFLFFKKGIVNYYVSGEDSGAAQFFLFCPSIVRGAHVTSSSSPLPFKLKLLLFPAVESSGLCVCVCVCDTPAAPSAQQRQTADDEPLGDI